MDLLRLVEGRDDDPVTEATIDDRHYKQLSDDLLTLGLRHRRLFEAGQSMWTPCWPRPGRNAGKPRLPVVNA